MRWITLAALVAAAPQLFAQSDTQPPQLVGVSLTPPVVDVNLSAQPVILTAHVTDNLSGVTPSLTAVLRSPSGRRLNLFPPAAPPSFTLDGNISAANAMPLYSEPGTWTIETLSFRDRAGNITTLQNPALNATLQVIDSNPDQALPQLAGITLSPSAVDVSSTSVPVTVSLSLTDDLAGIDLTLSGRQDFELRSPSGQQSRVLSASNFTLQSGNPTNGVWSATLTMPRYSEPGVWTVQALTIRDRAGATRFYDATALGAAAQLTVTSSPADTQPPTLTSVSFAPAFVNPALNSASVQLTLGVTDNLSGVSFLTDAALNAPGLSIGATFRSPSGAQTQDTQISLTEKSPASGTSLNGVWQLSAAIPPFSEEGTWKLSSIRLRDAARNLASLNTPAQIAAAGFPTDLIVIQPSLQTDGFFTALGGTVADNSFGARAQLTAPANLFTGATSVAIDVLQSPLGFAIPAGFTTAESYFVHMLLAADPGLTPPAPGLRAVLPLRNYLIPGTGIRLFRIDPATGALTPSFDAAGNPNLGAVDAGGLSATFAGVTRFGTLVGLLATALPVTIDIKPDDPSNVINPKKNGKVAVAIFGTPTFDVTKADPASIRFAGTPAASNKKGGYLASTADLNSDGIPDLVVQFEIDGLLLTAADTQGVIEGLTPDGRVFRGVDAVQISK